MLISDSVIFQIFLHEVLNSAQLQDIKVLVKKLLPVDDDRSDVQDLGDLCQGMVLEYICS